ncbi:MAG: hypothetical protein J2P36_10070 [Ktedonobacteraceae bacterium]|nr:hypothetical protein [Ktedonobacteraceae bacterium]
MKGLSSIFRASRVNSTSCTDWLDTIESQELLQYQRHSFDDIMRDVLAATRPTGIAAWLLPLLRPLIRRQMLRLSPYQKNKRSHAGGDDW